VEIAPDDRPTTLCEILTSCFPLFTNVFPEMVVSTYVVLDIVLKVREMQR
jgi:hypothetical protein